MQPTVIALGFFDGVHLGHAALLRQARKRADTLGLQALALTFDTHPLALIRGASAPLLSTAAQRERILREHMDEVRFLHFDGDFMRMPWQRFLDECLIGQFRAAHLVCGYDYRFGAMGEGTAALLAEACGTRGVGCDVVDRVALGGVTVSSTHIRALIAAGDVARAADFLGRPYALTGRVVHGEALGRTLGTPTANIEPAPELLLPKRGVYITRARCATGAFPSVTNVGVRPTVDGRSIRVETWLLDYDGDLYGVPVELEFHRFLRAEQKFDSVQALRDEIIRNAGQARDYFARAESEEP